MVGEPSSGEPYGRALVQVTDSLHKFETQNAPIHGNVDPVNGLPHQSDGITTPDGKADVAQADEG